MFAAGTEVETFPVGEVRLVLGSDVITVDGDDHVYEDKPVVGNGNAEVVGLVFEDNGATAPEVGVGVVPIGVA